MEAERVLREPEEGVERWAHVVIGAAIEVHRHLGPGTWRRFIRRRWRLNCASRALPSRAQRPVPVSYKGEPVGEGFIDLLVADRLIVELKAVEALAPIHQAQVISYLRGTDLHLGLLINFNVTVLKSGIKRVIRS